MYYGENKKADEIVENLIRTTVHRCQSCLVDKLLTNDPPIDGFSWEDIQNQSVDPSDWERDEIYQYADDNGINLDGDPRKLDRDDLISTSGEDDDTEETDDELREIIVANNLDEWIDSVREWSQENPQEVYEWWLVDQFVLAELAEMGEPFIDNDFGEWWGRTCSGQMICCDSTFYTLAEKLGYFKDLESK